VYRSFYGMRIDTHLTDDEVMQLPPEPDDADFGYAGGAHSARREMGSGAGNPVLATPRGDAR